MTAFSRVLNNKNFGYLFLTLLSFTFLILEVINDHFWLSDFEVYYRSAERLLSGDSLYRIQSDGHYIFKYSPVSALLFIPFTLLPFGIAKYFFWIFVTGISCLGYKILFELVGGWLHRSGSRMINSVMMTLILVSAIHFLRELHLGQINFILLCIYLLVIKLISRSNSLFAGVFLALTVFIKPFSLIYLPYLILKKKFKTGLSFFLSVAVLTVLPVVFYGSFQQLYGEYFAWFYEIGVELSNKKDLMMDGNLTIFSILARYTPFHYLSQVVTGGTYRLIILALLGLLILYVFWLNSTKKDHVVSDMILLTGLMPLIAYTSANAFCFVVPVICSILMSWPKIGKIQKLFSVTGLLLYGGNFAEIIGRQNSQSFDNLSLLSIGTVLLISVYISIIIKKPVSESIHN